MKKRILIFGALLVLAAGLFRVAVPQARAQNDSSGESIDSYTVSLSLEQSGTLHVSEDIAYDFGTNEKHGIFRTIPLYPDGWPKLGVDVIGVTDPTDGSSYTYTADENGDELDIKVGDPDVLVTGVKEYVIAYDVTNAVRAFSDHDELYWNAIGSEWSVPIASATVAVSLPAGIMLAPTSTYCYAGAQGSNSQDCTVSMSQIGGADVVNVAASDILAAGDGLTISVSMASGSIANTATQSLGGTLSRYLDDGLPIVPFILIFGGFLTATIIGIIRGNKKRAIIPKELKHTPIAPYYNSPNNLPPSQIGYIENRTFDASDFTAIILDLAIRGFLKITYIPKDGILSREDYELTALKPYDPTLPPEYKPVYDLFFTGGETSRVNSIDRYLGASMLQNAGALTGQAFETAGYLTQPKVGKFEGVVVSLFIFMAIAGFLLSPLTLFVLFPVVFILAIIAIKRYSPKFTPQGIDLMRNVLGFKMFLTLTETDRMKLMDAPKTSQQTFEAILPYAIALGVEQEWVKQFASMTIEPPRWINDPRYGNGFNAVVFVSSFNSFSNAMRSSTSRPSSSGSGGGGSVGGGGGGGGGGSW